MEGRKWGEMEKVYFLSFLIEGEEGRRHLRWLNESAASAAALEIEGAGGNSPKK